ncbi:FAD/NAD(P)-binding domain-containing protein [Penicillium maclennaniae]|uniref:FAD/NAD(P)-binding domain-containing protein n=1 Tax=Penicillium maclennaniae TaxID=1343394 RepID=UPI002541D80E|nr:FAD/NAD(P)-binding domain-containing protein [Penicillium maclennaniae]KAJ5677185.1 FAD/NAD(P)-binding domain-containing protein [Penicillium maclennaniae]
MAPLRILICGGGCAGPALAYWLARSGHQVTVIEIFPALRATGAQFDLRGRGNEAAKRMDLLETIRSKLVDEDGVALVDSEGNIRATVMANKTGRGAQSLTSMFEIMRGDLVRILYNATNDNVKYLFGRSVDHFEQKVTVYFSNGPSETFDLLAGADGQGSRIRKAILPPSSPDPYRRLGIHIAYWFISRIASDNNIRRAYLSPGGRMIRRRSHSPTETQVYFYLRDDAF